MSFDKALAFVLTLEGGYVNHPNDKGGATNKGITQRAYNSYRVTTGHAKQSVQLIEDQEVADIYKDNYWIAAKCPALQPKTAFIHFDASVNHGVGRAARLLQDVVGVVVDGKIGPQTIKAANSLEDAEIVTRYLDTRHELYEDIIEADPSQGVFYNGWMNRLSKLSGALLKV